MSQIISDFKIMTYEYRPKGVCAAKINFDIEDGIVKNVQFMGGCNGNTQGVASLVTGMKVDDAIAKIKGIHCGPRPTSCPDQLATALEMYKAQNA